MASGFAANLIGGIDKLYRRLNRVDTKLAIELLRATYEDYPRPAWNTGELRGSGAVYIGGKLIATTIHPGPNENGAYRKTGNAGYVGDVGAGTTPLKEMHVRKLRAGNPEISTVKGKITVIYTSDIAAIMHEWPFGFSDSESGPHYISAKLLKFGGSFAEAFRSAFR